MFWYWFPLLLYWHLFLFCLFVIGSFYFIACNTETINVITYIVLSTIVGEESNKNACKQRDVRKFLTDPMLLFYVNICNNSTCASTLPSICSNLFKQEWRLWKLSVIYCALINSNEFHFENASLIDKREDGSYSVTIGYVLLSCYILYELF